MPGLLQDINLPLKVLFIKSPRVGSNALFDGDFCPEQLAMKDSSKRARSDHVKCLEVCPLDPHSAVNVFDIWYVQLVVVIVVMAHRLLSDPSSGPGAGPGAGPAFGSGSRTSFMFR